MKEFSGFEWPTVSRMLTISRKRFICLFKSKLTGSKKKKKKKKKQRKKTFSQFEYLTLVWLDFLLPSSFFFGIAFRFQALRFLSNDANKMILNSFIGFAKWFSCNSCSSLEFAKIQKLNWKQIQSKKIRIKTKFKIQAHWSQQNATHSATANVVVHNTRTRAHSYISMFII